MWFILILAIIAALYGIGTAVAVLGWFVAFLLAIPVLMVILFVAGALLTQR